MMSEGLKGVFSIILALGNFMNGGNRQRGQADGFGLEILSKLKDVKSKDNSMTLLHYIVKTYRRGCGDDLDAPLPVPEPGDVDRSSEVVFDDIHDNITKLQSNLTGCTQKMQKVIEESLEENIHPFKSKMEAFVTSAQKQLNEQTENLEDCKQRFQSVLIFYQYQPKGGTKLSEVAPKDFFYLWMPFCSDFKDLWKKEQQRIFKEKLKETMKKQEERKKEVKKGKKGEGGLKSQLLKLSEKMTKISS